jgi:hypothetical protein
LRVSLLCRFFRFSQQRVSLDELRKQPIANNDNKADTLVEP